MKPGDATHAFVGSCEACKGWLSIFVDHGVGYCLTDTVVSRVLLEDARRATACSCPREKKKS